MINGHMCDWSTVRLMILLGIMVQHGPLRRPFSLPLFNTLHNGSM